MCKQNPAFCWIHKAHLNNKDKHYLREKSFKKEFQANDHRKQFCWIHKACLNNKDKHYLREKSFKKVFQANDHRKQAGIAILISSEIDFLPKVIKHEEEGHFIFIKGKFQDKFKDQDKVSIWTSMPQMQRHKHS